jgi:hypothetical protein
MTRLFASRISLKRRTLALGLHLLIVSGCSIPTEDQDQDQEEGSQTVNNGLSTNGLSTNGLSTNGLSTNGLSTNGLSTNGLSTNGFNFWFDSNRASLSSLVMKYVVRCAVPKGQSRTFTSTAGVKYVWMGELGLAVQWALGLPASVQEQQLVSACLGAHVNKFGVSELISVLGYDSTGVAIPLGATELSDFPVREGCFFGNLFTGDSVFVGNDSVWLSSNSSSRECALGIKRGGARASCSPMLFVGACRHLCTPDDSGQSYRSCFYQGKRYAVINTRVTADSIYLCGDQICQVSEQCGKGKKPTDCQDCGACL